MGVRYFVCKNCQTAESEYNEVFCEKCESQLCSCAIPEELKEYIKIWEDIWEYIKIDADDNIIPKSKTCDKEVEIIKKYLIYDSKGYGIELKHEYCPICNREDKNKIDPEYKEYLRLKAKFEK